MDTPYEKHDQDARAAEAAEDTRPKREVETRERALARLLNLALEILTEQYEGDAKLTAQELADSIGVTVADLAEEDLADDDCTVLDALVTESIYWIHDGKNPVPTEPAKRLGAELLEGADA